MRDVYHYWATNEIGFDYTPDESGVIGETDGTLDDFLAWMLADWVQRGVGTAADLPRIRVTKHGAPA